LIESNSKLEHPAINQEKNHSLKEYNEINVTSTPEKVEVANHFQEYDPTEELLKYEKDATGKKSLLEKMPPKRILRLQAKLTLGNHNHDSTWEWKQYCVKNLWETKHTKPMEQPPLTAGYEKSSQTALEISKFRKTPITMRKM